MYFPDEIILPKGVHRLVSVLLAPFGDCRQAPPEPLQYFFRGGTY